MLILKEAFRLAAAGRRQTLLSSRCFRSSCALEPKIGAHGKPVLFLQPKDFCGTLIEIEQA